ncbi:glycosyl hydrolase [Fulvivirga kasyanovii]|uniref:glucan endo-1,3-beta-D-glucosidase n=1 Tax=Fulvivirga kasyanovii TaxID=396812 RepID=A0ABW9RIU7_9BACT|nr:glycosyl hydrolase [Fulvivirga kasyanovii]MTI23987.1 carbohydrate-binding protein [Fulvivirga kasyanovii]
MKPTSCTGWHFLTLPPCNIFLKFLQQTIAATKALNAALALILLALLSFTVQAQVVPVGSGSYTTSFPGTDEAGRNTFPSGAPQLSGVAANKPVPTNDWWSNLVKNDHGGQAFNYPLSFRSETDGLVVNYTIPLASSANEYREPMSAVDAIKVGVSGLNATRSTIADHSDWTVTANWASGGNNFSATMGMGMPFVYFTKASGNTAQIQVNFNAPGVTVSGNKLLIQNNMNNSNYVVFGPAGSTWSGNGGVFTSSLAGKNYWSMALVPPGMDINSFIANYERYAYVFPANTTVDWNYNENTSMVTTTFAVTPDVKEGGYNEVLLGLLPHQWAHLGAGSAQPNLATYHTVRGELKMLGGNTFSVANKFSGVLPTLPNLAKYSNGFDIGSLNDKINAIKGDGLPGWTDSYNEGQNMNRLIQAARIADQIGNTAARDQLLDTVQERLEDWLTVEGGEVAFMFYYNDTWDALLGYPAGHSQDSNLNDHHFHWGYFIHAASALEQFRPGWANNWGPMINMLIRDAGNPSRTDNMFPFLRNFSPYAGHAWANGFATEPFGNDQESTSESMQFNASLIHWGTITNNPEIRDLGIYLYTTEVTAIQEYWFDIHDRTFRPEYTHEMIARIWSAGYDNGTWWTSDIAASYGIQLYPIHGGALYMGYDLDYVQEVWNGMKSKTEVLSNTPNANLWYDTYWSFLAFLDPAQAISLYNSYTGRDVKVGISDAQTYHWLHTMNALGQVADEITADYPIAGVFEKDGVRTYVAHNYGSTDITVHFSDGATLYVPAGEMATSKDTGASISISAPGIVEEPCTSGVNSNFTLEAHVTGSGVSYVEFFRNGASVGTDNAAPYQLQQSFSSDGVYTYTARAYSGSAFEVSNVYQVIVGLGTQVPYSSPHTIPGTFESGLYDAGGNGISYYDTNPNIYEANFRTDDEVDAASSPSQGTSIGWIAPGEWVEYSINATSGKYDIALNIAAKASEGGMSGSLSIDMDCNPVATINSTPLTGDWDTYQAVTATDINIPAGSHIIRVTFNSGVYNLGRLTFTRTGDLDGNNSPPGTPTGIQVTSTTASSLTIGWNASTDPDNNLSGYDVYLNNTLVDNVSSTSYTFTGLTSNTTYQMGVNARDSENAVSQRVSVNGTTDEQTSNGVPIPAVVQAENYTDMSGIQMEETSDTDGGQNVGWIDAGDWLEYEIYVPEAGDYTIDYRVASLNAGGVIEFFSNGTSKATTSFNATGDWQNWTTVSESVNLPSGDQTIRLVSNNSGWNINWIEFKSAGTTPPDGDGCNIAVNGDFSVEISDDATNPTLTFVPERSGVGSPTCILYYSTSPDGTYPGYLVSASTPYQINASAGQTIYFYYTYSLPEGGENNTLNNKKSFVVAQCGSSNARMGAETQSKQTNISESLRLYPNPANDKIFLSGLPQDVSEVLIYDASGRTQSLKSTDGSQNLSLDIRHLVKGLYFIRIQSKDEVITRSFMKE